MAVHVVPPIAGELLLIEEGAVCAEERTALFTLPSIVADVVRLAACLWIGVHARHSRHVVATERGGWHRVVDGVIVAWHSGDILKVLFVLLLLVQLVTVGSPHNNRSVVVVDLLVLWLGILRNGHWGHSQGLVVLGVYEKDIVLCLDNLVM